MIGKDKDAERNGPWPQLYLSNEKVDVLLWDVAIEVGIEIDSICEQHMWCQV